MDMPRERRPIILGTDWHSDCDDALAVRILAWAHKQGIIKILGISVDSAFELSMASIKGFLEYEGLTDVPLGLDHNAYDYGGHAKYQCRLAELASHSYKNSEFESAARMYRRLLAEANEKADIIEIGFSQVLAEVLTSKADDISPLSGAELFEQKVGKLWIMGGSWDDFTVREFNFSKTPKASRAISTVLEKSPVPVTMLGLEVGKGVLSGEILKDKAPCDVLYKALCDFGAERGRHSWDPMLVYLACVGDEELAGYELVRGRASVDAESGYNSFAKDENGKHGYVVKRYTDAEYVECLDEIILAGARK